MQRRNRVGLDWDNAWQLDTGGSGRRDDEVIGETETETETGTETEAIEVSVRFELAFRSGRCD